MAEVTSFQISDLRVRDDVRYPVCTMATIPVVSGTAAQNDTITVLNVPPGYIVQNAILSHSASLGTSATAQLKVDSATLTAASTAGGASTVVQNTYDTPSASARKLNVTIAGAGITATANIIVQVNLVYTYSLTLPLTNAQLVA